MSPLPDPVAGVKRVSLGASALQQATGSGHGRRGQGGGGARSVEDGGQREVGCRGCGEGRTLRGDKGGADV